MVITEEQAFMVITAMAVKENEIQLCSDEYLFLIELAKFIDPERKAYARDDIGYVKRWEKQAKIEKAAEEAWAWEIEDKEEREAEVYWESFYNH
jgi:hypothetical protein